MKTRVLSAALMIAIFIQPIHLIFFIVLFYITLILLSVLYAKRVEKIENGTFTVISDREMDK